MICNNTFRKPCCRVNTRPARVRFQAIDPDDRPICGSVYRLACANGKYLNGITDSCGYVTFCGVLPGSYELTQIAVPYGFLPDGATHNVEVLDQNCVKIDGLPMRCFQSVNQPDPSVAPPQAAPPVINAAGAATITITGEGTPGCKIELCFPEGISACTTVRRDGTWSIDVPEDCMLEENDVIKATQSCECQLASEPETIVVGP
ncbi:MAG: hypothetical protein LBG83_09370 [Oscillospiraceae bacterium]|jgi:hypothetical protein|nr:hypothetical protein [Oscillospiraceae bacterium]